MQSLKLVVMVICVAAAVGDKYSPPQPDHVEEMRQLYAVVAEQQNKMAQQEAIVARQQTTIDDLSKKLSLVSSRSMKAMDYAERTVTGLRKATAKTPGVYDTQQYACLYDVIDMSCPADSQVFITTASFAQYDVICTSECCQPDYVNDCFEEVKNYDDEEWNNLRLACNYQQNCSYQHRPHVMTTCPSIDSADYLTITYICSADYVNTTPLVAFTSYVIVYRGYTGGSTILFDAVPTNVGAAFNITSSTFTCPLDGLYYFSFHVMSDTSDQAWIHLEVNGTEVVTAWADNVSSHSSAASNSAYVECGAGEMVRLAAETTIYLEGDYPGMTSFSGVLVREYD